MRYVVLVLAAAACGRASGGSPSLSGASATVTVAVLGPGLVRGGGLSADCRSRCSFDVPAGTTVHLLPVADAQAAFSGWSGPCSGTAACDLVVKESVTVGASFAGPQEPLPPKRRLTVSIAGAGSVRSDPSGIDCAQGCAADFADQTPLTLTAVPAQGWAFAGFSGSCSGTACAFAIVSDAQVTATFTQRTATLGVDLSGGGTVVSTPVGIDCPHVCFAVFAADTDVVLSATPGDGFSPAGFSGLCSGAVCMVHLSADGRVGAVFAPIPLHRLAVALSGSGAGRVISAPPGIDCPGTCAASFREGTTVALAPTPDLLSQLAGWAGACDGSSCVFKMQADTAAVARFDNRRYVVMDLGVVAGAWWSGASAISPNGSFITGNVGGNNDVFLWDGAMHPLGLPFGFAGGVNEAGVVAGTFRYDPQTWATEGFRWQAGKMVALGTLGGGSSQVSQINRDGSIVGWAQRADGIQRAVVWKNGEIVDLGSLGGGFSGCSVAYGINASGTIVGESCTDAGANHAVVFHSPGVIEDLGTLGGNYGIALAINDGGVIVGYSTTDFSGTGSHAFVYEDGRMSDAGALPGLPFSQLGAINGRGVAVGNAFNNGGTQRGIIHAQGRMLDVNALTDGTPYTINSLGGIDEAGDLVGTGIDNGVMRAVVLRPR
jgi:probable HAF family extracellular repeat protein